MAVKFVWEPLNSDSKWRTMQKNKTIKIFYLHWVEIYSTPYANYNVYG